MIRLLNGTQLNDPKKLGDQASHKLSEGLVMRGCFI